MEQCGKLEALDAILPILLRDGHKILVYSQFVTALDVLEDYCVMRGHDFVRLDGATSQSDRCHRLSRASAFTFD